LNEMPGAMTLIEIKPHRWGWKVFEAPGVEPVFRRNKTQSTTRRSAAAHMML
jgi:hypothetical protein